MQESSHSSSATQDQSIPSAFVRNIPNSISFLRLMAAPVLLLLAVASREREFRWLLVFSLVSDIADGLIARGLKITSKLGALLDSTADILISGVAVFGIFKMRSQFVSEHYLPVILIVTLYLLALAGGFLRYGKPASFHTFACRVAAYAQGIFIVLLFFRGYEPVLFYLMIGISAAAYLEEVALVCLLPTWTANVGGLYRVLRNGGS